MKKIMCALGFFLAANILLLDRVSAQTEVKEKTKTGMSSGAKGAIIGGVAGAGVGAVVGKEHRARNAAIGAGIGAGGGYLYGHHRDKKHPRKKVYKYKRTVE
jgi:hypothetical protein